VRGSNRVELAGDHGGIDAPYRVASDSSGAQYGREYPAGFSDDSLRERIDDCDRNARLGGIANLGNVGRELLRRQTRGSRHLHDHRPIGLVRYDEINSLKRNHAIPSQYKIEPYFVFADLGSQIESHSTSLSAEGNAADIGVADQRP
jgi:hypothetical protein